MDYNPYSRIELVDEREYSLSEPVLEEQIPNTFYNIFKTKLPAIENAALKILSMQCAREAH